MNNTTKGARGRLGQFKSGNVMQPEGTDSGREEIRTGNIIQGSGYEGRRLLVMTSIANRGCSY